MRGGRGDKALTKEFLANDKGNGAVVPVFLPVESGKQKSSTTED